MAAVPSVHRDLKALRRLIDQADLVLAMISSQNPLVASARESLNAALALSKDLVKRTAKPLQSGAAILGAKGGSKTAERGPDYYASIAALRKNRRGGRPRKQAE